MFGDTFVYSSIALSPESILKNQIGFFDVNFFKDATPNGSETVNSIGATLRTIVSQVYLTIRDISLVAMLIVTLYVAIRSLLALSPKEKSRYKENFVNCIIGIILILIVHVIMSVSVTLVDMITSSIAVSMDDVEIDASMGNAENMSKEELSKIAEQHSKEDAEVYGGSMLVKGENVYKELKKAGYPNVTFTGEPTWWQKIINKFSWVNLGLVDFDDEYVVTIEFSNFTEQARYMCQQVYEVDSNGEQGQENWNHIGWAFVYIMLVILTVAFVWLYGKRVIYMALLTMFAPIIGVMYPINRVNGGRAQTLNLWFREFIGNLLIQPLHLFLYTVLIGSVMELAIGNSIYVIIALMGMLFAERLLKDMFGIQDTRIGGLGKAIQDTTRAIKTAERATSSVAKTIGRVASRGARGAIGAYENYRNSIENEESEKPPREQNTPPPVAGQNGEDGSLPPPSQGGLQPPIEEETFDEEPKEQPNPEQPDEEEVAKQSDLDENVNAFGWHFNPYTDEYDENYNPLGDNDSINIDNEPIKELDEEATMQKYLDEGGNQNADGLYFNPYTDEYDESFNPLKEGSFQVYKEVGNETQPQLDEVRTLENYRNAGYKQNSKGEYFNPYTDEYDKGYTPLRDNLFMEYRNTEIGSETKSSGAVDSTTMSMVDKLNNNQPKFKAIDGNSERIVRSGGGRNVYEDKYGNHRIGPSSAPDGKTPMAMAMAAGSETTSSTNFGVDERIRNTDTTKATFGNERGLSGGANTMSSSGTTSFGTSEGSQSIPDGNNIRSQLDEETVNPRDNMSLFWTNPNEPESSSEPKPDLKSVDSGKGIDIEGVTKENLGTESSTTLEPEGIHRLTPDEYVEMPSPYANLNIGTGNTSSNNNGKDTKTKNNKNNPETNKNSSENKGNKGTKDTGKGSSGGNGGSGSSGGAGKSGSNTSSNNNGKDTKTKDNKNNPKTNNNSSENKGNKGTKDTGKGTSGGNGGSGSSGGAGKSGSNTSSNNNGKDTKTKDNKNNPKTNNNSSENKDNKATKDTGKGTSAGNGGSGSSGGSGNSGGSNNNQGNNQASNNENNGEQKHEKYEATTARRVVEGAEEVAGITTGIVGTLAGGMVGMATSALQLDLGETVEKGINAVGNSINIATGSPVRYSSSEGSASTSNTSNKSSSGGLQGLSPKAQNVRTIVNETGMSEEDASAFHDQCQAVGIADDRNMALVGKVYKSASESDKKEIIKISKMLYEMRRNRKSKDEASKALEGQRISPSTREALEKMYDKLHA